MESLIVYSSVYGSTEKYAHMLSEKTGIRCINAEDTGVLPSADRIIFMGGIYAGKIHGLKKILPLVKGELILVTVGIGTPDMHQDEISKAVKPARAELFCLRGAIDYSRLSVMHKAMMFMMYKMLKRKQIKTPDDRMIIDTYGKKADFVSEESLLPLINRLKGESL